MARNKRVKKRSTRMRGTTRSLAVRQAEAEDKAALLKMRVDRETMDAEIRRARIRLRRRGK